MVQLHGGRGKNISSFWAIPASQYTLGSKITYARGIHDRVYLESCIFSSKNHNTAFFLSSWTSRYGDEHKLAGFSATLQAIVSFVENRYAFIFLLVAVLRYFRLNLFLWAVLKFSSPWSFLFSSSADHIKFVRAGKHQVRCPSLSEIYHVLVI